MSQAAEREVEVILKNVFPVWDSSKGGLVGNKFADTIIGQRGHHVSYT